MPPDRIQMIENEMAKFENACMRRDKFLRISHAVQMFYILRMSTGLVW